jgi:hypothetical protein
MHDWTAQEHLEWFGERAGIAEFDAGMTRHEAEKEAYRLWRDDVGPNVPAPREMQELVRKARKLGS